MISLIVYGRNDSYGYNLHKRAALSLNNFAHILTDADEILFVDYNTPNGFPTFPEAIADTLTPKARRLLRIFRVPPQLHSRLGLETHLKTIEPIARNVALRRSHPQNRWILSTNTDMIFILNGAQSLSTIAEGLPDGHYGSPRFELPEGLWESLPRQKPRKVINEISTWGRTLHLKQVVMSWPPHLYDAPGDFQLMPRSSLFNVHGFNEAMIRGWHVDSNISKRISILLGPARDIGAEVEGYHCDHTRQETPMHASGAAANDSFTFIDSVSQPDLPNQAESWGLAKWDIEEINLQKAPRAKKLISSLANSLSEPPAKPPVRRYNSDGYDIDSPGDDITTVFLTDLITAHPVSPRILWLGGRNTMPERLKSIILEVYPAASFSTFSNFTQFNGAIKDPPGKKIPYDFVILDFRAEDFVDDAQKNILRNALGDFLEKLAFGHSVGKGRFEGTVIGIDVVNSYPEKLFHRIVKAARTPYLIGFRHGTISVLSRRQLFNVRLVILEKKLEQLLRGTRFEFITGVFALPRRLYRGAIRAFTTRTGLRLGGIVSRTR